MVCSRKATAYSKMKPEIHPAAEADLLHHAEYLRCESVDENVPLKFAEEIRRALEKIEANPLTWSFAPGSRRVRKVQVPRFRMQVFYLLRRDGVPFVLEFAGAGLRPRWRGRL